MKKHFFLGIALITGFFFFSEVSAQNNSIPTAYADKALVKKLPGFSNHSETVNGIKLHYVSGGKGKPLFLLPGWPETWWSYHPMAPALAAL